VGSSKFFARGRLELYQESTTKDRYKFQDAPRYLDVDSERTDVRKLIVACPLRGVV
jgi:hypothetical protein